MQEEAEEGLAEEQGKEMAQVQAQGTGGQNANLRRESKGD